MSRIEDLRKYYGETKGTIILSNKSMDYLLRIAEAADALVKKDLIIPWRRTDETGEYTCVETEIWKDLNYNYFGKLIEALEGSGNE